MKLTCVNRVVAGFGRYSWVREIPVWNAESAIAPATVVAGPSGTAIPVRIEVPAGQPPTREDAQDALVWSLEVEAALPGLDYHERFEVPVFAAATAPVSHASTAEPPASRTIDARTTPAGGLEVTYSAAPNASAALVAMGLWTGWLVVFVFVGVPAFLAPFSVVVGIIFLALPLWLWLGRSRVTVGQGTVTVRHSVLGIGQTTRVPIAEIQSVSMERTNLPGVAGAAAYRILLVRRAGRALTVVAGLSDEREAERVVADLRRAIGVGNA